MYFILLATKVLAEDDLTENTENTEANGDTEETEVDDSTADVNEDIVVENSYGMDPTWGVVFTLLAFALFFLFSGLFLFRNTVQRKMRECWGKCMMRN